MGKKRRQEERAARKVAKAEAEATTKRLEPTIESFIRDNPPSDFNLTHGGIDPQMGRKPQPPSPQTGYHWEGAVLVNGMGQPVGRWLDHSFRKYPD